MDHQLIQELVYYAESRFMKIILAFNKSPRKRQKWIEMGLCREIVSIFYHLKGLKIIQK